MKKFILNTFLFMIGVGNVFNSNAMNEQKESSMISCSRKIDKIWFFEEQDKSFSRTELLVIRALCRSQYNFLKTSNKDEDHKYQHSIWRPERFSLRGRYVTNETLDAFFKMSVKEIDGTSIQNDDGTKVSTPQMLEVSFKDVEDSIIKKYILTRAEKEIGKKEVEEIVESAHARMKQKTYWHGFASGTLLTASIGIVGVGSWYYFNRNK